jgi:5'-deoxynucleotidase YfbR-like HD superfamily hydrolase
MKIKVTVEAEIQVEFDETSEEFQALFQEYKESIDSTAEYMDFAESIANMAARYGTDEFVEGVGYPRVNGVKHKTYHFKENRVEEHDCPVNLICEDDVNGKIQFDACGEIEE